MPPEEKEESLGEDTNDVIDVGEGGNDDVSDDFDVTKLSFEELYDVDNSLSKGDDKEGEADDDGAGDDKDEEDGEAGDVDSKEKNKEKDDNNGDDVNDKKDTEKNPLEDRLKKLEEALEAKNKLFDKLGTEVGLLRKKTPEEDKAEIQRIRDLYETDPIEGNKAWEEYKNSQLREKKLEETQALLETVEKTRDVVGRSIPGFEGDVSAMGDYLSSLGYGENNVNEFKRNPYSVDPATLYFIHKAYKGKHDYDSILTERDSLKSELDSLKEKFKTSIDKIEKGSKSETIKSRSGSPTKTKTDEKLPVHSRKYDEL